ncbi:hypothetical protein [Streptomyces griseus]|uniref:hypothetical protein n=1 Tax=Streptomyces griseus TaxID=1911 RepID=UPI00378E33B0
MAPWTASYFLRGRSIMSFTDPAKSQPVICPQCSTEVPQVPGRGKVKRYCNPSHGRTWRTRMRSAGWL